MTNWFFSHVTVDEEGCSIWGNTIQESDDHPIDIVNEWNENQDSTTVLLWFKELAPDDDDDDEDDTLDTGLPSGPRFRKIPVPIGEG